MSRRSRRGGTLALVLCLYLALAGILMAAVGLAAMCASAAERDYRRSQALALAEAGVAEAKASLAPHALRPLGAGSYSWTATRTASGRRVVARGEVLSVSGVPVTRSIHAILSRAAGGSKVSAWEEGR